MKPNFWDVGVTTFMRPMTPKHGDRTIPSEMSLDGHPGQPFKMARQWTGDELDGTTEHFDDWTVTALVSAANTTVKVDLQCTSCCREM